MLAQVTRSCTKLGDLVVRVNVVPIGQLNKLGRVRRTRGRPRGAAVAWCRASLAGESRPLRIILGAPARIQRNAIEIPGGIGQVQIVRRGAALSHSSRSMLDHESHRGG